MDAQNITSARCCMRRREQQKWHIDILPFILQIIFSAALFVYLQRRELFFSWSRLRFVPNKFNLALLAISNACIFIYIFKAFWCAYYFT